MADWRGDSWDRISSPHAAMGAAALDGLAFAGTERVLDAGCASGHLDAVLSTATFRWILDHDTLFGGLAGILREGGRLSSQCGGEGDAGALIEAARAEGVETAQRFNMAGTVVSRQRLEAHGFRDLAVDYVRLNVGARRG